MKTVKMFEGTKVVTDKGTKFYKDLEILNIFSCPDENFKSELIRALICLYPNYVDLSEFTEDFEILKIRLVTKRETEISIVPWEEIKEERG